MDGQAKNMDLQMNKLVTEWLWSTGLQWDTDHDCMVSDRLRRQWVGTQSHGGFGRHQVVAFRSVVSS